MERVKQAKNFDWTIITAALIFVMNMIKFLSLDGSQLPIPSTLFNMTLFLAIIIFFVYKKIMENEQIKEKEKKQ